jgi:F-type H+/Na+-transporting ATPase subunit alpha
LASYRELEAFAQLGTELDSATQRQLNRGKAMVELLKQGQYKPYHMADQVISIFSGNQGFCDDIPLSKIAEFEEQLLSHIQEQKAELRDELIQTGELTDELAEKLKEVIGQFKKGFMERHQPAKSETG